MIYLRHSSNTELFEAIEKTAKTSQFFYFDFFFSLIKFFQIFCDINSELVLIKITYLGIKRLKTTGVKFYIQLNHF